MKRRSLTVLFLLVTSCASISKRNISSNYNDEDLKIPNIMYRASSKETNLKLVRAGKLTREYWKTRVMTPSTQYDLPEFRKGLYGAEIPGETSLYSYETLYRAKLENGKRVYSGSKNWMISFEINKKCLTPKHVERGGSWIYYSLKPNSEFDFWFLEHQKNYKDVLNTCFTKTNETLYMLNPGPLYDLAKHSKAEQEKSQKCTRFLEDYYRENEKYVIYDDANDQSWYVRNFDCVENIKGSSSDIIDFIYTNSYQNNGIMSATDFFGDGVKPGPKPIGNLLLLNQVLADNESSLDINKLEKIIAVWSMPENCGEKCNEFWEVESANRATDSTKIAVALFTAYIKAEKNKRLYDFKNKLNNLFDERIMKNISENSLKDYYDFTKITQMYVDFIYLEKSLNNKPAAE